MPKSNTQVSTNRQSTINEGFLEKGGINKPPSSARPSPPIGQGGSGSFNQGRKGGSGSSSQGRSGSSN